MNDQSQGLEALPKSELSDIDFLRSASSMQSAATAPPSLDTGPEPGIIAGTGRFVKEAAKGVGRSVASLVEVPLAVGSMVGIDMAEEALHSYHKGLTEDSFLAGSEAARKTPWSADWLGANIGQIGGDLGQLFFGTGLLKAGAKAATMGALKGSLAGAELANQGMKAAEVVSKAAPIMESMEATAKASTVTAELQAGFKAAQAVDKLAKTASNDEIMQTVYNTVKEAIAPGVTELTPEIATATNNALNIATAVLNSAAEVTKRKGMYLGAGLFGVKGATGAYEELDRARPDEPSMNLFKAGVVGGVTGLGGMAEFGTLLRAMNPQAKAGFLHAVLTGTLTGAANAGIGLTQGIFNDAVMNDGNFQGAFDKAGAILSEQGPNALVTATLAALTHRSTLYNADPSRVITSAEHAANGVKTTAWGNAKALEALSVKPEEAPIEQAQPVEPAFEVVASPGKAEEPFRSVARPGAPEKPFSSVAKPTPSKRQPAMLAPEPEDLSYALSRMPEAAVEAGAEGPISPLETMNHPALAPWRSDLAAQVGIDPDAQGWFAPDADGIPIFTEHGFDQWIAKDPVFPQAFGDLLLSPTAAPEVKQGVRELAPFVMAMGEGKKQALPLSSVFKAAELLRDGKPVPQDTTLDAFNLTIQDGVDLLTGKLSPAQTFPAIAAEGIVLQQPGFSGNLGLGLLNRSGTITPRSQAQIAADRLDPEFRPVTSSDIRGFQDAFSRRVAQKLGLPSGSVSMDANTAKAILDGTVSPASWAAQAMRKAGFKVLISNGEGDVARPMTDADLFAEGTDMTLSLTHPDIEKLSSASTHAERTQATDMMSEALGLFSNLQTAANDTAAAYSMRYTPTRTLGAGLTSKQADFLYNQDLATGGVVADLHNDTARVLRGMGFTAPEAQAKAGIISKMAFIHAHAWSRMTGKGTPEAWFHENFYDTNEAGQRVYRPIEAAQHPADNPKATMPGGKEMPIERGYVLMDQYLRASIHLGTEARFDTLFHEFLHIFTRDFTDGQKRSLGDYMMKQLRQRDSLTRRWAEAWYRETPTTKGTAPEAFESYMRRHGNNAIFDPKSRQFTPLGAEIMAKLIEADTRNNGLMFKEGHFLHDSINGAREYFRSLYDGALPRRDDPWADYSMDPEVRSAWVSLFTPALSEHTQLRKGSVAVKVPTGALGFNLSPFSLPVPELRALLSSPLIKEHVPTQNWATTLEKSVEVLLDPKKRQIVEATMENGHAFAVPEYAVAARAIAHQEVAEWGQIAFGSAPLSPEGWQNAVAAVDSLYWLPKYKQSMSQSGRVLNAGRIGIAQEALQTARSMVQKQYSKKDAQMLLQLASQASQGDSNAAMQLNHLMNKSDDPPTFANLMSQLVYNNILSSPPMHLGNCVSNTVWQVLNAAAITPLAAVSDATMTAVARLKGEERQRTVYMVEALRQLSPFIDYRLHREIFASVRQMFGRRPDGTLSDGTPGAIRGTRGMDRFKDLHIDESFRRANFYKVDEQGNARFDAEGNALDWQRTNNFLHKLNPYVSFSSRLLRAADIWFSVMAYEGKYGALEARANKNLQKYGPGALIPSDMQMREEAERFGRYATFTDEPGHTTQWLLKWFNGSPLREGLRPFLLPFISTPMNIFKRSTELIPGVGMLSHMFNKGNENSPEMYIAQNAEMVGKQLTGFLLASGIASMFGPEDITADAPKDPGERAAWSAAGKIPFAIRLGDHWVSYRRMEPFSMIFAGIAKYRDTFGGPAYEAMKQNPKIRDAASTALGALATSTWQYLVNSTWLDNLASLTDSTAQANVKVTVANALNSVVPYSGLLRGIASEMRYHATIENRDVYSPDASPLAALVIKTLPGYEGLYAQNHGSIPRKPSFYGPQVARENNVWSRWTSISVSPAIEDPVEHAFTRLNRVGIPYYPGIPFPSKQITLKGGTYADIPPELYREWALNYGVEAKARAAKVIESASYYSLPDTYQGNLKRLSLLQSAIGKVKTHHENRLRATMRQLISQGTVQARYGQLSPTPEELSIDAF